VLYFDYVAGDVYISENEGRDWGLVQGIPRQDATQLIEHPFDNRVVSAICRSCKGRQLTCHQAFVLTKGTKHYKTDDRGRTWRSFDVPLEPALSFSPLSFHADPQKAGYILYQGVKCERHTIFGLRECSEKVRPLVIIPALHSSLITDILHQGRVR
jgi:hypothetical protein